MPANEDLAVIGCSRVVEDRLSPRIARPDLGVLMFIEPHKEEDRMTDDSIVRARLQTFTREEYDEDPVRIVKATRQGPVEIVDENGKRTMYLTRPGPDCTHLDGRTPG